MDNAMAVRTQGGKVIESRSASLLYQRYRLLVMRLNIICR